MIWMMWCEFLNCASRYQSNGHKWLCPCVASFRRNNKIFWTIVALDLVYFEMSKEGLRANLKLTSTTTKQQQQQQREADKKRFEIKQFTAFSSLCLKSTNEAAWMCENLKEKLTDTDGQQTTGRFLIAIQIRKAFNI